MHLKGVVSSRSSELAAQFDALEALRASTTTKLRETEAALLQGRRESEERLQARVQDLESLIRTEAAEAEGRLRAKAAECEEVRADLQAARSRESELLRLSDHSASQLAALQAEFESAKSIMERSSREMAASYEMTIVSLTGTGKSKEDRIMQLTSDLNAARQELTDAQNQARLDAARSEERFQEELSQLQVSLALRESATARQEGSLQSQTSTIESLSLSLKEQKRASTFLESTAAQQLQMIQARDAAIMDKEGTILALESSLTDSERQRLELQGCCQALQLQLDESTYKQRHLAVSLDRERELRAKLEQQFDQTKKGYSSRLEDWNQTMLAKEKEHSESLAALESQNAFERSCLEDDYQSRLSEVTALAVATEDDCRKLRDELESLAQEKAVWKAEKTSLLQEKAALTTENRDLIAEKAVLVREKSVLAVDKGLLVTEKSELATELSALLKRAESSELALEGSRLELASVTAELAQMHSNLSELVCEVAVKEARIEELEASLAAQKPNAEPAPLEPDESDSDVFAAADLTFEQQVESTSLEVSVIELRDGVLKLKDKLNQLQERQEAEQSLVVSSLSRLLADNGTPPQPSPEHTDFQSRFESLLDELDLALLKADYRLSALSASPQQTQSATPVPGRPRSRGDVGAVPSTQSSPDASEMSAPSYLFEDPDTDFEWRMTAATNAYRGKGFLYVSMEAGSPIKDAPSPSSPNDTAAKLPDKFVRMLKLISVVAVRQKMAEQGLDGRLLDEYLKQHPPPAAPDHISPLRTLTFQSDEELRQRQATVAAVAPSKKNLHELLAACVSTADKENFRGSKATGNTAESSNPQKSGKRAGNWEKYEQLRAMVPERAVRAVMARDGLPDTEINVFLNRERKC